MGIDSVVGLNLEEISHQIHKLRQETKNGTKIRAVGPAFDFVVVSCFLPVIAFLLAFILKPERHEMEDRAPTG